MYCMMTNNCTMSHIYTMCNTLYNVTIHHKSLISLFGTLSWRLAQHLDYVRVTKI